jgi:hypothetical protein
MNSEINGNFRESYGMVVGADSISARQYITNPLFNKRKILQNFYYAKREFMGAKPHPSCLAARKFQIFDS